MLRDFQAILSAGKLVNQKRVPYYIRWVRDCYNYFRLYAALAAKLPSRSLK